MNKQLKERLKQAKIQVKWRNCGTWQKANYKNLLNFVNECDVKITKFKKKDNDFQHFYKIKMLVNEVKIEKIVQDIDLVRKLYDFVSWRYNFMYLKARVKIVQI